MEDDYQRYRREQEEAVSNKSGSSPGDVLYALLPNICSVLLALTVITLAGPQINQQTRILIEFCITIIPCVLCCTVLSDKVLGISQIFIVVATANILTILARKPRDSFKFIPSQSADKLSFITNFRALTNIITVCCILAVDFTCFPRKYVKTETYGYSLMDTGVGLFMIANALVAPEARNVERIQNTPFFEGLKKTFKGCIPLIALGLARFAAIEILGYQRHVSEYGVHWNFFLTLASVKLFTGVLSKNLSSKYALPTGLWILAMHEYALSTKGLKEWVLSNEPRNDILSANREGWVSIPGYVGLYLLGISLGKLIHTAYEKNTDNPLVFDIKLSSYEFHIGYTRSIALLFKLYILANLAYFITYYCEQYFRVSRRLANTGYCSWILTISILSITALLMIEVIMECIYTGCVKEKSRRKIVKHLRRDDLNAKETINIVKTLEIFEAINDNGLMFFLFANVFTGAVNLSMKTLHVDESRAVAIIIIYMVVNVTFALLRNRAKRLLIAKKNN